MNFNENQLEAVNYEGQNILVSAGAGSGKTAVLTERILRKLKNGVSIDNLIIITFTKAAAAEMKERIKHKIETEIKSGNTNLEIELQKLETANISTFDAFSLNLLKTYHYKLDLSQNIKIGESLIFTIQTNKIIDQYFQENLDSNLLKFFALGDKKTLYNSLYTSYMKYSINIDYKFEIKDLLNDYYNLLKSELNKLVPMIKTVLISENEVYTERAADILSLLELEKEEFYEGVISCYKDKIRLTTSKKYKEDTDIIKLIRENASNLQKMLIHKEYEENILQNDFQNTLQYKKEIEKIFSFIDKKLFEYKYENAIFDFIDISKLVIKLLEENEDIRLKIKNQINEVLIDEYQDTVQFQDYLVSLITENNIFMVGDVKQAIYGFRNATPESFNRALNDENCKKIFLNTNYRSCKNVIDGINNIFSMIMNEKTGGVLYDSNQALMYGNSSYDNIKHEGIEFIKYELGANKHETEAQLIANDILKKQSERDLNFKDFAILCRSKSQFDTYTKVLLANGINVNMFSDVKYISSFEIILIKNLFELAINNDNKLAKASVLRSFLYAHTDEEIAILVDQPFQIEYNHKLNNYQFFDYLLREFNILQNIKYLSNPNDAFVRLRYTYTLMKNFDDLNYSLREVVEFFNQVKTLDRDITFSYEKSVELNAVTLMTIHKSKGLEFPIVYMPSIDSIFNISDTKEHIIFNPQIGIITHNHFENTNLIYSRPTYDNKLFINNYRESMLSEEMRLLYVAMTRAKQDFVILYNNKNQEKNSSDTLNYTRWLNQFATLGEVITDIDVKLPEHKKSNNNTQNLYKFKIIPKIEYKTYTQQRASQLSINKINEHEQKLIEQGNQYHKKLEFIDFSNLDKYDSKLVNNLKEHSLFTSIEKYYSEFEYIYNNIHGIIDLLIENKDEVIIVDYKLKNISKPEYIKQLDTYEEYIKTITNKKISKYLYSILDNELLEIKNTTK